MDVITVLNECHKHKSFVYKKSKWNKDANRKSIDVIIEPRSNGRPICSQCSNPDSIYDTAKRARKFEFIPIFNIPVYFIYHMRRVNCKRCGVKAEKVPWGSGKKELTKVYMQFLAHWSKSLSWKEVAGQFNTSWEKVFRSVESIVNYGLKHRSLSNITAIGVDEIAWKKGHKYMTLVYQINKENIRLLWVGKDRKEATFHQFFDLLGEDKTKLIEYVCSDMWKPYLKVIKERVSQAIHILDRFHIVARLNKAVDEVRAGEHKQMQADGIEPILTKSRWLLLKKPENLKKSQSTKLKDILSYNLKSVRAYLLKEDFRLLWDYVSPSWAGKFIDQWTTRVMRSKIEPMKKEAKTIRKHKSLILNYFKAKKKLSSGVVEGLNTKVKLTIRKAYGFRQEKTLKIALYHSLGNLPEPELPHKFYN